MEHPKKKQDTSKHNPSSKSYLRFSGIAFEMLAIILVFVWGGYALDDYLNNSVPWFLLLGVLIGVTGSIYHVVKQVKE